MHSVRSVRAQFQDRRDDVSEPRKADRSQRLGIAFRKQGRLIEVIADDRTSADDRGRAEVHAERSLHRDENGLSPDENTLKAVLQVGILFEDAYSIEEKSERKVQYADSKEVEAAVLERFPLKPVPMEFTDSFEEMSEEVVSKKRPPKTRKNAT